MENIKIGNITMTHGLKGELKLYSEFSFKEKVLQKGFPIFIHEKKHTITSVRIHKNCYLITIDELFDINLVEEFRNSEVFVNLSDIPLKENEVILETLVGYRAKNAEEMLGIVIDIMYNKSGYLLKVKGIKTFYVPYNPYFVKEIKKEEQIVYFENAKDLML